MMLWRVIKFMVTNPGQNPPWVVVFIMKLKDYPTKVMVIMGGLHLHIIMRMAKKFICGVIIWDVLIL